MHWCVLCACVRTLALLRGPVRLEHLALQTSVHDFVGACHFANKHIILLFCVFYRLFFIRV